MKMSVTFKIDRYVIGKSYSVNIATNTDNNKQQAAPTPPEITQKPREVLVPRSPGSVPSNGVEFFPQNLPLAQAPFPNVNK